MEELNVSAICFLRTEMFWLSLYGLHKYEFFT